MSDKEENRYLEPNFEDIKLQQEKKSIKINAEKSQFIKKAKNQEEFEQKADATFNNTLEKNQKAIELAKSFWNLIKNKELQCNKGPTSKSIDKEIVDNLILYGRELNSDLTIKEDSYGSMAIITLLMKAMIYQKDLCNEFEFRLAEVEKQLKKMSSPGK